MTITLKFVGARGRAAGAVPGDSLGRLYDVGANARRYGRSNAETTEEHQPAADLHPATGVIVAVGVSVLLWVVVLALVFS